ncbi:MAG: sulfurtransferase TusA family protein [Alphaproteobacteria bacterium]|uniref:Sulfurtransferase TusA family protein n=1 Tax=Candidatus Nitrobium versatile TaxID=2884831 RepID=A0A953JDM5_9BACT|nr:sulfurtransferase TusA family protein [Candidatus Nitrobium versatile]
MHKSEASIVLDVKGLHCPMPVLRTKKAIDSLGTEQVLQVIATDPASKADIPALLGRLGHELLELREEGGEFSFLIKKK